MAKTLQEQLMSSGLVDKKKAKSIQKDKHNKRKQIPKGQIQVDEVKLRIEKARKEKILKDRELNQQQKDIQDKKAITAQISQLIKSNCIAHNAGDIGFQFAVDKKIKKIYINNEQQEHLLKGHLCIATLAGEFFIVPSAVANKIIERDETIISYKKAEKEFDEIDVNDPYKDFEIPDDLMW